MRPHAFDRLRALRQQQSTRPYRARGITVTRCQRCQLSLQTCICPWRRPQSCHNDFILLMHTDEVFKPTNTGRLIADQFPENTYAFCWSRCEPEATLIQMIKDSNRQCVLVFPPKQQDIEAGRVQSFNNQALEKTQQISATASKKLTLIILDGTWKQANKMMRLSSWLQHIPILATHSEQGQYRLRKAPETHQLSTAEAASTALAAVGEQSAAQSLLDYFTVFSTHYQSMRLNQKPVLTDAHQRLQENLYVQG